MCLWRLWLTASSHKSPTNNEQYMVDDDLEYCCKTKRCFQTPRTQVDGLACGRCLASSYCKCNCETYMKWFAKNENQILKQYAKRYDLNLKEIKKKRAAFRNN